MARREKLAKTNAMRELEAAGVPFAFETYEVDETDTSSELGLHIAQMLGLTGWVKNRWDGKVEMEVQGKREEIGKMISMLYQQRFIWIEDIEEKEIPVEKESSFSIH